MPIGNNQKALSSPYQVGLGQTSQLPITNTFGVQPEQRLFGGQLGLQQRSLVQGQAQNAINNLLNIGALQRSAGFIDPNTGEAVPGLDALNRLYQLAQQTTLGPFGVSLGSGALGAPDTSAQDTGQLVGSLAALIPLIAIAASDERLKDDIETIENSLEKIKSMRGVSWKWKEGGTKAAGVVAQEIEKVTPELTAKAIPSDLMLVNYQGLVGHLIEAVKELSARVEELEKK